jgi:hypothetical protein
MGECLGGALRRLARAAAATLATAILLAAATAVPAGADIYGTPGLYVAYEREGDLWVVDVRGLAPPLNLTQTPGVAERHPAWSAPFGACDSASDGSGFVPPGVRGLAYERDGDVYFGPVLGNPPGMQPAFDANLTATFGPAATQPAVGLYTRTEQVVVFAAGPPGDRDLWARPLFDDVQPMRLTTGANAANPDWSGNGDAIVYDTGLPGHERQLAILPLVGNAAQGTLAPGPGGPRLVTGPGHADPSWWGEETLVAEDPPHALLYTTRVGELSYVDMLVQPRSPAQLFDPAGFPPPVVQELTGDPGGDEAPAWEPGGTYAVLQSDRDAFGNVDVYRVESDGEQLLRLTSHPGADVDPDWEPWTEQEGGPCFEPTTKSPLPGPRRRPRRRRRETASAAGLPGDPPVVTRPDDGPPPEPRSQPPLRLARVRVAVSRVRGHRLLVVSLGVNRPASARIQLVRRGRVLATWRPALHGGRNRVAVAIPRRVAAGWLRVRLTVRSDGIARTTQRAIRIGSAGRR